MHHENHNLISGLMMHHENHNFINIFWIIDYHGASIINNPKNIYKIMILTEH
jgi:predicted Ser/Thr protein kinase